MFGNFLLKELIAVSDQGRNVHVKLLSLCVAGLKNSFEKENKLEITFCLTKMHMKHMKKIKKMVCDSPLLESLFKFEV